MTLRAALLLLLATGCATELDFSAFDQETPETAALRATADAAWASAGVSPGEYTLALLPADELQDVCQSEEGLGDGHTAGGCTYIDARVIILDAARRDLPQVLTHEIGHLLHGRPGHLQCGGTGRGPDVMCPSGQMGPRSGLTARDAAFAHPPG